ncbi:MAG: hypothetical protein HY709_00760 [Candidatus Latescibacteria bacterium]|nr:hypothetical protein [Candidatus Latescibacterota bacterium]
MKMKRVGFLIGSICFLWTSQTDAEMENRPHPSRWRAGQIVDLQRGGLLGDRSPVAASPSGSDVSPSGTKSPKLAFLMSLVLPGTGELYAGAAKRGIGFLAVEGGSWLAYTGFRSSGKDKEKDFRAFAEQHWFLDEYQAWRGSGRTYGDTTHTLPFKDEEDRRQNQGQIGRGEGIDTQQYYELIGKYDQFVFGWKDKSSSNPADSAQTVLSKSRVAYEDMRNESNKQLKRASFVLGIVLFNHVVSAIDAAKFAQVHGNATAFEERLRIRMDLMADEGRQVPILVASKRFK